MIPSDNMLVLVVHAASQALMKPGIPVDLRMHSVPLTDDQMMSLGFSLLGSHFNVSGLCNYLRP